MKQCLVQVRSQLLLEPSRWLREERHWPPRPVTLIESQEPTWWEVKINPWPTHTPWHACVYSRAHPHTDQERQRAQRNGETRNTALMCKNTKDMKPETENTRVGQWSWEKRLSLVQRSNWWLEGNVQNKSDVTSCQVTGANLLLKYFCFA